MRRSVQSLWRADRAIDKSPESADVLGTRGQLRSNFYCDDSAEGSTGRLAYVSDFVEQAKSPVLIERAVVNSG